MILKLSALRVVVFAQCAQKGEKTIATLWILSTKKCLPHSATRWLTRYPSLPRMLQMYPASHSYFMSIDKPTVVLKRFFFNSMSKLCLRHLDICNHWCLISMSKFQTIGKAKACHATEVVSCPATGNATIQVRESDVRIKLI